MQLEPITELPPGPMSPEEQAAAEMMLEDMLNEEQQREGDAIGSSTSGMAA